MARAIDGELLELEIANIANKLAKSDAQKALMGRVMYCVEHMPTLTPQNEPLTLEQLREMDGQPVWDSSLRCWGIVKSEKDGGVFLQTKSGEFGLDPLGRVKIYRRPPEGEA